MSLNFVAAEDGLEDGPKFLKLARILKVPRSAAFWSLMRLRRLIVNEGNGITGALPKTYDAEDIAVFLEWPGRSAALVAAFKATGFLSFRRGRGFFYPGWQQTVTGSYAHAREKVREADRRRKRGGERENGEKTSGGIPADSAGIHVESGGETPESRHKGSKDSGGTPPNPPRDGGDSLADARWQWVLENAPTPQNPAYCKPLLAQMSADDWALVQRAWGPEGRVRPDGSPICVRDARVLAWPSDAFLRKQAFLRWRPKPPRRPIARASSEVAKVVVSPAEQLERRLAETDAYVMQALADPDLPEAKKRELREKWLAKSENAERAPPWKKQPNGQHAKGAT